MLKKVTDTAKNLKHIRCRYEPVQDRIRVTGELENDGKEAFWLTRRMLTQIVPHMAQYIEKQAGDKMDKLLADVKAQLAKSQQAQSEIRWRESAESSEAGSADQPESTAASSRPTATPVQWLVVKMNLASTDVGCHLMFHGEGGESVSVTLRAQPLCRWLAVLHAQSQQAQWQSQTWPSWVSDLVAAPSMPAPAVLH